MEEKKKSKISMLITILLFLLVILLLIEFAQLSEIKSRINKTQVFWDDFKPSEGTCPICPEELAYPEETTVKGYG